MRRGRETGRLAETARLLRYDADFYRLWIQRARTARDRAESSQRGAVRSGMERLARSYDRVAECLAAHPATFIPGEFYASNVLIHETEGKLRVCPVDWEMAAVVQCDVSDTDLQYSLVKMHNTRNIRSVRPS